MREESVKAKRRGKKERSCGKSRRLQDKLQRVEGKRLFFPLTPFLCSVALHAPSPLGSQVARLGTDGPPSLLHAGPAGPSKRRAAVVGGHGPDGDTKEGWTGSDRRPGTFSATHKENEAGQLADGRGGGAIKANVLKEIQLKNVCDCRDRAEKKDRSLFLKLLLNKGFDPEVSAFTVFCESLCALMAVKNLKL